MKALQLFTKNAPNKTFLAIVLGSLAGLFYALLIPVVMIALSGDSSNLKVEDQLITFLGIEVANSGFALLFLSLCFLILICNTLSEVVLARVALDIRFKIRKQLYSRVIKSPVAALEKVGASRLIQVLSTDVTTIVQGAQLFPAIVTNLVTLTGMLAYVAFINIDVFYLLLQVILIGIVVFQIPVHIGTKYFSRAREHKDILQEGFKGLIEGAKELKLSKEKQNFYQDKILHKEESLVRSLEKKGQTAYSFANNLGGLLCFFAIGVLVFIYKNYLVLSTPEIVAVVMVLLYVTGPVGTLLNFVPQLAVSRISLRKIDKLYDELPEENVFTSSILVKNWKVIRFEGVSYIHQRTNQNADSEKADTVQSLQPSQSRFTMGPVTLKINRGEITFIAGGNGSGKSTLSKIISHHYLPAGGEVYFDDVKIDHSNIVSYRQEIACIYSDYYLFEQCLVNDQASKSYNRQIEHYLELFGISDKVELVDGHFSTLKLSDGQRRRLALVVALAENRSLYVFDEWAADQDPQFKQVFYREILPYLKNKGKAVVVISHDDRYFDIADQLLTMENGKLTVSEQFVVQFLPDKKTQLLEEV